MLVFTKGFFMLFFNSFPYKHPRGSDDCYETIMFGRVTHKLDVPAMLVRSYIYDIHIL